MNLYSSVGCFRGTTISNNGAVLRAIFATAPQFHFGAETGQQKAFCINRFALKYTFNRGI
jgi:hypothetical protein